MYQKLFALQEETLKVVANQKRLEIIQLLKNSELTVTDMIQMLGLPQANLSQHLAILRLAKIVATRKHGTSVYYRLTDPKIAAACGLVREFLKVQHQFDPDIGPLLAMEHELYPVVTDTVCGMRISLSEAAGSIKKDGKTYYFCASGCEEKFNADPNRYITKAAERLGSALGA
ncbi:MAG TPA: metalloregulator ArsR/SmtB family transcription factor [Candidatus Saccharimonadales bacterium]|nr:metalloregulator ArsR/SmtB family transcription factor [Candidatus Saccharimonadales bacterium]